MADISERLQKILTERFKDNQTAFAKALDLKQTTVANYFNQRKSAPSLEVLRLMVDRLGIDARWLLTGKEYQLNGVNATDSPVSGSSVVDSTIFIGVPAEIKDLVMRYETQLRDKENQLNDKERLIAEKDERIKELKERIEELKAQKK